MGVARGGSFDHQFVVPRIYHHDERGVRRSRADQPGALFYHREPQVCHVIEIEVFEGSDRTNKRAQHRQILEARSNVQLNGAVAPLALVGPRIGICHLVSRQYLTDITTISEATLSTAFQSVSHQRHRVVHPTWTGLT